MPPPASPSPNAASPAPARGSSSPASISPPASASSRRRSPHAAANGEGPVPGFARYPSLDDRTVFVSGGASGIGASIVEHFAAQGAKVGFVDIDKTSAETLVSRIAAKKQPKPLFVPCDLRDIDAL